MAFGRGEYQYFPLPAARAGAGTAPHGSMSPLAPIANRWNSLLKRPALYPPTLAELSRGVPRGGTDSTPRPLLLRYEAGDYKLPAPGSLLVSMCFPLQATVLLSAPGADFEGGEFVLTGASGRARSRAPR